MLNSNKKCIKLLGKKCLMNPNEKSFIWELTFVALVVNLWYQQC